MMATRGDSPDQRLDGRPDGRPDERLDERPDERRGRWSAYRRIPVSVHAAALLFFAVMVGFLVVYPTFYGFDEPQHLDRIYATTDGDVWPDPGELYVAGSVARATGRYVRAWPFQPEHSLVDRPEVPRDERPSLIDLGGHTIEAPGGYSNQLSQHPPGYYALVGAVMWLVPSDATIPVDAYVFVLRVLDIAMLVPVPYLIWWGARKLTGEGPAAQAAAFVPALVPGIARVGASVNNDNLLILATTALLALLAGVMKGDLSLRTARWIAVLLVVALLTKGTALVLPIVVGAGYAVGWLRTGGRPPWGPFLTVAAGGAVGAVWWVRNLLLFGAVQPDGWGNRIDRVQGPPRAADDPASLRVFLGFARDFLPERFWGGLGLIEPPQLPGSVVLFLGWFTVAMAIACLVFAHHNRVAICVLMLGFFGTLVITTYSAWLHFQNFTSIPGLQGRYMYPYVLGLAVVIAIGLTALLRRFARFAPLVLLGLAVVVELAAAYVVVRHIYLPIGQSPRPGNIGLAYDTLERFAPFSPPVTAALVAFVGAALVAVVVVTIRSALPGQVDRDRSMVAGPLASAGARPAR